MSSSFSSAAVAVDKATSDLLLGPDWTMNIEICDSINSNHWQAKDVVKAVKKRLQHRNAKVQLLALTLLETMVKNCGDYVHFQVAEKNLLGEMVKIVKKKADMQLRDKILVLLDSWQQAFGGPGGKYPQYYWAYEDLRRSGVEFPRRSVDAAPIFTPPVTHPPLRHSHAGYGMPSGSSRRLDETMATEIESVSLSSLEAMRDVMELLNDMLQAVDPTDTAGVKDDVIVDLVDRCRSNQKKLMQMLTATSSDEELLARGLELNDSLQNLLAKHDAIALGSPLPPVQAVKPTETDPRSPEVRDWSPGPSSSSPAATTSALRRPIDEEDEEEDDFAQLARRHSKPRPIPSKVDFAETSRGLVPVENNTESHQPTALDPSLSNALVLSDPPAPVRTTKEQDLIDVLSLTLSTPSTMPEAPQNPTTFTQNTNQLPASSTESMQSHVPQGCPESQGQIGFNSYVVPWAQPRVQQQFQPQFRPQPQSQMQPQAQTERQVQSPWQSHPSSQFRPQPQPEPQAHTQLQQQLRSQNSQNAYGYPPPPWAASPSNIDNLRNLSAPNNMHWTPRADTGASSGPMQANRPLQQYNSFPARVNNRAVGAGDSHITTGTRNLGTPAGQKPFIPSYRLFEDLNVFGNLDGRLKVTNNTSPSLSGSAGPSTIGGGK